ncbi:MAG: tRNA pseudouridine(13) synthase TruD [Anaerolineales bacterium]|nr:tRNA pseudouridine(13) synthase TruD [Anaerolineales bacterium]
MIRATPEDFVVEEVPLYEAQGDGQHLYVNITKVGYTTKEVQFQLERLFGLKRGDVSFAGMKDKRARTTQTFSLSIGHKPVSFAAEAADKIRENLPVEVNWVQFHRNKLRPGHLLGNRFTITVRELAAPVAQAAPTAQAIVARLQQTGLPNYYGPQRMGDQGANVRQGLAVLRGETQKRDRWLQRFLISAYQSYLCNVYLARRLAMGEFEHILLGDVAKKYATGGMFDVVDVAAEQPRYAAHEISFTAPMYGSKMWPAQAVAGELEAAILAESGITMDVFAQRHVEGTRRLGRLLIPDLTVAPAGDALVIAFMLPKGGFATTVMREFMKVDDAQLNAVSEEEDE